MADAIAAGTLNRQHRGTDMTEDRRETMRIRITRDKETQEHAHQEIELIYILEGIITLQLTGDRYSLKKGDIVLINANKVHSFGAPRDVLVCTLYIDYKKAAGLLGRPYVSFWVNSAVNGENDVEHLRGLLDAMVRSWMAADGKDSFGLLAREYAVMECLEKEFLLPGDERWDQVEDQRIRGILTWVDNSYGEDVTLAQAAERLYLSEAYLSRLFKRVMHMNFRDYLSRVRMNYALEMLLYTDRPVFEIAVACGFSNAPAFNKVFRKANGCTPSQFRQRHRNQIVGVKEAEEDFDMSAGAADNKPDGCAENASVMRRLQNWEKEISKEVSEEGRPGRKRKEEKISIRAQVPESEASAEISGSFAAVDCGTFYDLLQAKVQEQLLILNKNGYFGYVRVGGLFMPELYLRIGRGSSLYNFSLVDQTLDFLLENKVIPIIDLSVKGKSAAADLDENLFGGLTQLPFQDLTDWKTLLQRVAQHLVERYFGEAAPKWYFVLEDSQDYRDLCEAQGREPVSYISLWNTAARCLREEIPGCILGGEISLLESSEIEPPDFVTLHIYPYNLYAKDNDGRDFEGISNMNDNADGSGSNGAHDESDHGRNRKRSNGQFFDRKEVYSVRETDPEFAEKKVAAAQRFLRARGYGDMPVFVSEWGTSLSERNAYNDSTAKAAHIAMHFTRNADSRVMFCYGQGSDYFSQYLDTMKPVVGARGLLTRDGIRKPAYYVFQYANRLHGRILGRGEHFLAVQTAETEFSLILFIWKNFGHEYYLHRESEISIPMLGDIFEDREAEKVHICLQDISDGVWKVRRRILRDGEQVIGTWTRMGCPERISRREVQYMTEICQPRIETQEIQSEQGTVLFDVYLEAHDVQMVQIRRVK